MMNFYKSIFVKAMLLITLSSFIMISTAQADLVGYWDFETGSGLTAYDQSAYANDGNLVADTGAGDPCTPLTGTTPPDWITGKIGSYALQFCSGSSNYNSVWIDKSDSLTNLGSQWSFAMWLRQDSRVTTPGGGGGYPRVISCPNYEIELGVPSWEYDYFWPYGTGAMQVDIGTSYIGGGGSTGQWYHLALTYDGLTLRKYINGTLVPDSVQSIPGATINNIWDDTGWVNNPLKLACQVWPNKDWFIGAMDDVAIWADCYLDADAVADLSNETKTPLTVTPTTGIPATPESAGTITFIYDPTFIIRYDNGQVPLDFGQKSLGEMSFNWQMEGILDNNDYFGLVNAGAWDGDYSTIEYAGYVTIGDRMVQTSSWKPIYEDIKYDFTARLGAENGVGSVVGVKIYSVDPNDANDKIEIGDIKQTIASSETWYDVSATWTSTATHHLRRFKVECYITGGVRGTDFGYFDFVRIDANEFLTCKAIRDYGATLPYDFDGDCIVSANDLPTITVDWAVKENPEPITDSSEMLTNPDFYLDLSKVPLPFDFVSGNPAGWKFSPATSDVNVAGIQNFTYSGQATIPFGYEPAGGSVGAYFDPDTELMQTAPQTLENGETYYLSTMIGGTGGAYLSLLTAYLEVVDDIDNPTTITQVAEVNMVLPESLVWRALTAEYTAPSDGDYLRIRYDLSNIPEIPGSTVQGYGVVGSASLSKIKPDIWPRTNLLTNGDFEDYSSLPMGNGAPEYPIIDHVDGWIDLFQYVEHWTEYSIPGWEASDISFANWYGLQCMFWSPAPQPAKGRVACYLGDPTQTEIEYIWQKTTSETIQNGTNYYLDFMACINGANWATGEYGPWPNTDPCAVVDVYWASAAQNTIPPVNQLLFSLEEPITGPLIGGGGYNVPFGHWVTPDANFVPAGVPANSYFFVVAYCNDLTPYLTFEEIFLSKQPRPNVGPYTCVEAKGKYGMSIQGDLNNDCNVNFLDIAIFANSWMQCNDPVNCP